ncbi:MAG: hypothetical protein QXF57_04855, partial [Acidilobaceae archaeon]
MKLSRDAAKGYLASILSKSSSPWELLSLKTRKVENLVFPGLAISEILQKGYRDPAPAIVATSLKNIAPVLPAECEKMALALSSMTALEPLALAITSGMSFQEATLWLREHGVEWRLLLELVEPPIYERLSVCESSKCLYFALADIVVETILGCDESRSAEQFSIAQLALRIGVDSALLSDNKRAYLELLEKHGVDRRLVEIVEKTVVSSRENPLKRLEFELEAWRRLYAESGVSLWVSLADLVSFYATLI